jgi:hypothetical protein
VNLLEEIIADLDKLIDLSKEIVLDLDQQVNSKLFDDEFDLVKR